MQKMTVPCSGTTQSSSTTVACPSLSTPKWTSHAQERTNNQDVLDVETGHKTREGTREDARPVRSPKSRGRRVYHGYQAHVQETRRKGTPQEHARAPIRLVPLDELYIAALTRVHENATLWFPEIEQVWAVTERMKGPTNKWIDDLTSTGRNHIEHDLGGTRGYPSRPSECTTQTRTDEPLNELEDTHELLTLLD
ncbi:hypothetical protein OH76DRAFT_696810 [Lentinus brumalis]|uniref:Uncharacterized protein n=1 Tax=Lentinus brumalis TaxID=2498619 RepID=A0A371D6C2_9APHY|nr:hypothetical protein OH76DRAFT_696810 [Polyporus brumalis]